MKSINLAPRPPEHSTVYLLFNYYFSTRLTVCAVIECVQQKKVLQHCNCAWEGEGTPSAALIRESLAFNRIWEEQMIRLLSNAIMTPF